MRTAIYTRISSDPTGQKAGVARQEKDCKALVESAGWELAGIYTDNDRSAYSGKARPEYERLLADIESGAIEALVAWHPDRLHRSPVELESFIDLVETHGVTIATVSAGSYDLSSASGRMTARVVGAVSRHESEHKSERHKAKALELAREGKPSGGGDRPFGYDDDRVTVREDEALHIKAAAERLLSGGSLRSLVREWNEAGIRTTAGNEWRAVTLARMMRSARIAGLRSHKGEVIGPAVWPGIISEADHEALNAIFAHNASRMRRTPRKYLLTSGLAVCGLCGADLVARPRGDGRRSYVCAKGPGFTGCGKIRVLADPFESWIRAVVLEAVSGPGLAQALADQTDVDASAVVDQIGDLEDSMEQLSADYYADHRISRSEYFAARDAIEARIEKLRASLVSTTGPQRTGVVDLDDFQGRDLGWQRQFVQLIIDRVVVNPAVRGRNQFDPDRFDIRWKV